MNTRTPLAMALSVALAGCIFSTGEGTDTADSRTPDPSERLALATTDWTRAPLARSGTVTGRLTYCPEITFNLSTSTALYVAGSHRLTIDRLPDGVTVSWPEGDTLVVPSLSDPAYRDLPPANDPSVRYCVTRPFVLARSASSAFAEAVVVPTVLNVSFPAQIGAGVGALPVTLIGDAAAGAPPPPAAAACSTGRWTTLAAPASERVTTSEFDVALDSVEPSHISIVRVAANDVLLDQLDSGTWRRKAITAPTRPELLRLTRASGTSGLSDRTVMAWRETDFGRPVAEQSRVMLAWRTNGPDYQADAMAVSFANNVRGLAVATSQAEAVVGWFGDGGAALRTAELGSRTARDLALPADLPATGVMRRLLLASDPVTDTLVLATAMREADGTTRLRSWLRARPGAAWVPLPVLDAGAAGPSEDIGDMAITLDRGEVLMAWTWGTSAFFSSNARQQLQLQRWTAGTGWRAVADTTLLPDVARLYALQPQGLQVSACGEVAFMSWGESKNYPLGAVHGAMAAGGGWDTFGHADLAPLPDGTGAFGSKSRLLADRDGRPVLAVLLAPPTGGPSPVVLRRFAP